MRSFRMGGRGPKKFCHLFADFIFAKVMLLKTNIFCIIFCCSKTTPYAGIKYVCN